MFHWLNYQNFQKNFWVIKFELQLKKIFKANFQNKIYRQKHPFLTSKWQYSQSNKARKWCWWIYGTRKGNKKNDNTEDFVDHWRLHFELCFLIAYRHFLLLPPLSLFIEFLLCNSFTFEQRTMIFLFSSENFITRKSESRATKSCRTWKFRVLFYAFHSIVKISRTRFSWELRYGDGKLWEKIEREKIFPKGCQCVCECVCLNMMRFNATK